MAVDGCGRLRVAAGCYGLLRVVLGGVCVCVWNTDGAGNRGGGRAGGVSAKFGAELDVVTVRLAVMVARWG